jgi:hypothetical protein
MHGAAQPAQPCFLEGPRQRFLVLLPLTASQHVGEDGVDAQEIPSQRVDGQERLVPVPALEHGQSGQCDSARVDRQLGPAKLGDPVVQGLP